MEQKRNGEHNDMNTELIEHTIIIPKNAKNRVPLFEIKKWHNVEQSQSKESQLSLTSQTKQRQEIMWDMMTMTMTIGMDACITFHSPTTSRLVAMPAGVWIATTYTPFARPLTSKVVASPSSSCSSTAWPCRSYTTTRLSL